MRKKILVTGGCGFIGSHLVEQLIKNSGADLVVFDRLSNRAHVPYQIGVNYFKGDIRSINDIKRVFIEHGPFETVYHLASAMPNKLVSDEIMWETNVVGSKNLIVTSVKHKVKSFVFTSSNVTYGIPLELPVTEQTPLKPLEVYGKSKTQAETELAKFADKTHIQIFRCPVVTGVGRLGLQAILYEFISEDKNVYVLGDGRNKYQFVDVNDVCNALTKASNVQGFDIYTIGADNVLSLRDLYAGVIKFAGSKSRIVGLPKTPALFALVALDKFNLSPLGVYQYTMMGRSIYADTSKIKKKLNWKPQMTNLDTFIENYKWYIAHKNSFKEVGEDSYSANRSLPKMGILKLLKLIS